jgi:small subunit ribosomal protein S17
MNILSKTSNKKEEKVIESKGKTMTGFIVSDKMDKTVVVEILRLKKHPKYRKYFKSTSRYKAHDQENQYKIGDRVLIRETKPLSKDKRWVVVSKI